jgi:peroxiredoxin
VRILTNVTAPQRSAPHQPAEERTMIDPKQLTLLNEANETIALDSLWQDGPVLLFFMRQLGCGLCRQQLLKLKKEAATFARAGCTIAIIIMGDGTLAARLRDMYQLPFPVYADPALNSYAAFDIGEGSFWQVMNPAIVARQVGTLLNGMKPMWGDGSIRQLGGLVVINGAGEVVFRHVASPIFRYPPWSEVLAALKQNQPVIV